MKDFIKKYMPYILIICFGLFMIISKREYGIGAIISIGGCAGYYHGIDKGILKH